MKLFWKPKGRPITIKELKNGMHVEGYRKERFSSFWKKLPHAEVRIKPYKDYGEDYGWRIIELLIPGTGSPTRLAIDYGKDQEFRDYSDDQFRLYDGLIYTKPRRRRFP